MAPLAPDRFRRFLPACVLCACFLAAGALLVNETMVYTPDSVHYLAWARSLASLQGFRIDLGSEPSRYVFNAPLYPLLLSPVAALWPWSVLAAKAATLMCGGAVVLIVFFFFRNHLGKGTALVAAAMLALNPLLLLFSTQILSDVPFLFCIIGSFWLCERIMEQSAPCTRDVVLLALVSCAAILLREVGFTVVAAVMVSLLLRRRTTPLLWVLLAVLVTSGLWYVRNELIVAAAEHPDLRNTHLLFSNVLTPPDSPMTEEVLARWGAAGRFYGPFLGRLILAPLVPVSTYGLEAAPDALLAALHVALDAVGIPLVLLTVLACGWGAAGPLRRSTLAVPLLLLVACYAILIALYPVVDIRFLLPLLPILLYCAAAGVQDVLGRLSLRARRAAGAAVVLLVAGSLIPNLAWVGNLGALNASYRRDPEKCLDALRANDPSTHPLALITRPAASWITAHSPENASAVSYYNDVGMGLDGRKVDRLNKLISPEEFENHLRDYGTSYVVSGMLAHEIPDFEAQMILARRFQFTPVFRFGDITVFSVSRKKQTTDASLILPRSALTDRHILFVRGIQALKAGKYDEAGDAFGELLRTRELNWIALYYHAIAEESASHLDEAEEELHQFRSMPQAAAYIQKAQYHEGMIALLRQAASQPDGEDRASLYHTLSLSYWILGLRPQAEAMLLQSLRADPHSFLGHTFEGLYALAEGDARRARSSLVAAIKERPGDSLAQSLGAIITALDSIDRSLQPLKGKLALGKAEVAMRLYEMGIDQAQDVLADDPRNKEALQMLAELYERNGRNAPALAALRRLALIEPQDQGVQERIRLLTR